MSTKISKFAAAIARSLFDAQSAVSKAESMATDALADAIAAVSVGERVPAEAFEAAGFSEASAKVMASYVNIVHGKGAQFGGAGKVRELLGAAMADAGNLTRRDALLAGARAMRDVAKDAGDRKVPAKAAATNVKAAVRAKADKAGGKGGERGASAPKPLGDAVDEARTAYGAVMALWTRLAAFGRGRGSQPWRDVLAALNDAAEGLATIAGPDEDEAGDE